MPTIDEFPDGPYTEDQLQMLERGWYGRSTMRKVIAEVRRLQGQNTELETKLKAAELEYQNRYRSGR